MPPEGSTRYGSDTQGEFFIFDLENFETWLTFVLGNMYVGFGGNLFIQDIGTPMGTSCASNLANFFLAMCELQLVTLDWLHAAGTCFLSAPAPVFTCSSLTLPDKLGHWL